MSAIGNPNLYMWQWPLMRTTRNITGHYPPKLQGGIANTPNGARTLVLNDLTQMKKLTVKNTREDNFIPTLNLEFMVNDAVYFTFVYNRPDQTIHTFDLETLVGNFGAPPLILNKGDNFYWRIFQPNTPNANDITDWISAVWADVIGYPLP